MSAQKTTSKDSLKEIYSESKKRIKMILNLLAQMNKDNQFYILPDEQTISAISDLSAHIVESAELETDNQYRNAIIQIANWIHAVCQKDFIKSNHTHYPHPLFVAKKGAQILHSFLHRDLRRKQFSSEENEIYQNYLALTRRLPSPSP